MASLEAGTGVVQAAVGILDRRPLGQVYPGEVPDGAGEAFTGSRATRGQRKGVAAGGEAAAPGAESG